MSYAVEPSDLHADRAGILGLWSQNLPDASDHRYAWLYESGAAAGWVVKSDAGAVVGATGLMRRTMRVFGEVVQAGQAIDLNVDKEHRTLGPAIGLQRAVTGAVQERRLRLIYGLPNPQSEPVLRRCGYRVLDPLGRWARPLRLGDALLAKLPHPRMRKAAAAVINPLLLLKSPERFCRLPPGLRVEGAEQFDERFDALWKAAAGQFAVIGERTSAYLRWRFGRCPGAGYQVVCLENARRELLAYLVYRCCKGIVRIGDFFFAGLEHFDVLLAEFLRRMRRRRIEAVAAVYLGCEAVGGRLARLGFRKRPPAGKILVYADPRDFGPDSGRLADKENWYLTGADIDTDC